MALGLSRTIRSTETMRKSLKRPLILDILAAIYFLGGVFAIALLLAGKDFRVFDLITFPLFYGILTRKTWAAYGIRLAFAWQFIVIIPFVFASFFGDPKTTLYFGETAISVVPFFGGLFLLFYLAFIFCAVFSKRTVDYFEV